MNRFVLAGLLAAPLLCVCSVGASAAVFELDRQMYRNIYGPGCLRPDHMLCHGGGWNSPGCGYEGGGGGCGIGCGCGHAHHCAHCGQGRCGICTLLHSNCPGPIPGPWYQYWPDAQGNMVGPASSGPWSLERHFEVPAPLGGNPYFPAPAATYPGYGH